MRKDKLLEHSLYEKLRDWIKKARVQLKSSKHKGLKFRGEKNWKNVKFK